MKTKPDIISGQGLERGRKDRRVQTDIETDNSLKRVSCSCHYRKPQETYCIKRTSKPQSAKQLQISNIKYIPLCTTIGISQWTSGGIIPILWFEPAYEEINFRAIAGSKPQYLLCLFNGRNRAVKLFCDTYNSFNKLGVRFC